jgi:5'-3' exonuclease
MSLAEQFKAFTKETAHTPLTEYSKVLLVDGTNNYIRCFCASSMTNENGEHRGGTAGFLLSLGATIRQWKPSRVVIVFDGRGGSQRRRKLFDDYKAGRRSTTKFNRKFSFTDEHNEQQSMTWQLLELGHILKYLPLTIIAQENVEADDVIAYLAQVITERGGKSIIMSSDKDFLQLVDDNVQVWNPSKKMMYTQTQVVEHYKFHPNNFLLYRAITGDTSDNIPGVKGIKEATLIKYFPELGESDAKDINHIFHTAIHLVAEQKKPAAALVKLLDSKSLIERNIELMSLKEMQMSGQTKISVLDKFDGPIPTLQKFGLTKLVIQDRLLNCFNDIDSWMMDSFSFLGRFSRA